MYFNHVIMEYIEQYTEVNGQDGEVSKSLSKNEEDIDFIDDSIQNESFPSDYVRLKKFESFKLKIFERNLSSADEHVSPQPNINDFLDLDIEARKCVHPGYDPEKDQLKIDDFDKFQLRIKKLKDELYMHHRKNDINSF